MYQQPRSQVASEIISHIKRVSDNAMIPFDPDNIDYQQYLKWLAEGNQPLPADE